MRYQLTYNQLKWLMEVATADERTAFLSQGPVDTMALFDTKTGDMSYVGRIRGVRLNNDKIRDDEEQALADAQKVLDGYLEKAPERLDEAKLGIDGWCFARADEVEELDYRINKTVHLWNLIPNAEESLYWEEDFASDLVCIVNPHKSIQPLCECAKPYTDIIDNEELHYEVVDSLRRHGHFGIVMTISAPVKSYMSEDSCTYTWGHCHIGWVYGEDMNLVLEAVRDQLKQWEEEDKARSRSKGTFSKDGEAAHA